MTNYADLSQKPKRFLSLTAYTLEEFLALLPYFTHAFAAHMEKYTVTGKPRRARRYSTYKNSPLPTIEDKLLFILVYLKQAATQELHGETFAMTQSVVNQWVHLLQPVLNQALAQAEMLPAREAEAVVWTDATVQEDSVAVYFHDGTERAIPRPRKPEEQQQYYSGKKKRHTIKNNVIINAECRIIFLSRTCEGKKHDKRIADEANYHFPVGSYVYQDTGFQGFGDATLVIIQPQKKPRGQELPDTAKAQNHRFSSARIRVEHAIGGAKRYRIVKEQIRNWKSGFRDQVMETCCGLHNFRLRFRPWNYTTCSL
jgi:hypothetical protein